MRSWTITASAAPSSKLKTSKKEELHVLKSTLSAVVARSVGATPAATTKKKRHKKPGQKKGHAGKSRKRPEHIDARVTID